MACGAPRPPRPREAARRAPRRSRTRGASRRGAAPLDIGRRAKRTPRAPRSPLPAPRIRRHPPCTPPEPTLRPTGKTPDRMLRPPGGRSSAPRPSRRPRGPRRWPAIPDGGAARGTASPTSPRASRTPARSARARRTNRGTAPPGTAGRRRSRSNPAGCIHPACRCRHERDGGPSWDSPRPPPRRRDMRKGPLSATAPRGSGSRPVSPRELLLQVRGELAGGDADLLQRVAITHGDRLVLCGLAVHSDAEGRSRLVLAAIAPADRAAVVVEHVEGAAQIVVDAARHLRHAVLVHQREYRRLERGERGLDLQHDPLFPLDLLLPVGIAQHDERRAIRPGRRLDHVGEEPLVGRRIEVLELLPRLPLVVRQIEVAAVVDPLEFVPSEGELIFDVVRVLGVVRQLVLAVLMPAQLLGPDAEALEPLHPLAAPEFEPLALGPRLHEELHLLLLEFPRPEDEVSRRDLVAERLADLGDPERDLLTRRLQHVEIIDVDALGGLRPQIDDRGRFLHGAHERLEHQVELARDRERSLGPAYGALCVRLPRRALDAGIVGAEP